jgi:hypothetical protein
MDDTSSIDVGNTIFFKIIGANYILKKIKARMLGLGPGPAGCCLMSQQVGLVYQARLRLA